MQVFINSFQINIPLTFSGNLHYCSFFSIFKHHLNHSQRFLCSNLFYIKNSNDNHKYKPPQFLYSCFVSSLSQPSKSLRLSIIIPTYASLVQLFHCSTISLALVKLPKRAFTLMIGDLCVPEVLSPYLPLLLSNDQHSSFLIWFLPLASMASHSYFFSN